MRVKDPPLLLSLIRAAGHTYESLAAACTKADGTRPSRTLISLVARGKQGTSLATATSLAEAIGVRVDLIFMPSTTRVARRIAAFNDPSSPRATRRTSRHTTHPHERTP